jgi:predicted porin
MLRHPKSTPLENIHMKHSIIALAALAALAGGSVQAQSSVTLYGVIDAAVAHGSGNVSSKTQLKSSGYNSSHFGIRGTEDLGGGLSASFALEAGVNNDNGSGQGTNTNNQPTGGAGGGGAITFNRQSWLSLAGGWGELRVGRDYSPQFRNTDVFDPMGTNGVGTNGMLFPMVDYITTYVRASNSIAYLYNTNGWSSGPGLYGTVQYYLGENNSGAANSSDGKGGGVRVGYASGPFNVALALSRTEYLAGDAKQNNIGASWDFGVAKLMAQYSRDGVGGVDGRGYLVGGHVPVGAGVIRLSYARYQLDMAGDPTNKKYAIGYVHNLSKRTALFATYAHVSNRGTVASNAGTINSSIALNGAVTGPGGSSNGYDFGIRHSF